MLRALRVPVPLKWKFLIGILDLVLLFGTVHIYLVKIHLGKGLEEELHFRLKSRVASIAHAAVPLLLRDERVALHQLLLHSKQEDPWVHYIVVLDQDGMPAVHTFEPGDVPKNLLPANSLTPDRSEHYVRIEDARRLHVTYLDVAYPLGKRGKFGTLRVGIDETGIRYTLNRIALSFLFMILLFMVLGMAGAFVVAWWVSSPIREIQSAIQRFDMSSPVPRIDVQTGDELEDLAKSLERMMMSLKNEK